MATKLPTTPQDADEQYDRIGQAAQERFNPTGLSDAEKAAARQTFLNDQEEAAKLDIKKSEENPFGFDNGGDKQSRGNTAARTATKLILRYAGKGAPLGLIGGIICGILALITSFLPLMPVAVYHNLLDKFDSQRTSYSIRMNKVVAAKINSGLTDGSCTMIQIRCRFSRPSNYMLKQFESQGIVALDKSGHKVSTNGIWPNARPASYTFNGGDPIAAPDFMSALQDDSTMRAAFNNANKTRLQTFSDSVFETVAHRFGFDKTNKSSDDKSDKDVQNTIDEESKGADTGAKDAVDSKDDSKIKQLLKSLLGDEAKKEAGKLANDGKGDAVGLVAGAVCTIGDVPGVITRTARAYEMGEVIRFAMANLTPINAMMAGKGTAVAMTTIGNNLTKVVNGKSALDSFGIKYTISGQTSPGSDSNYKKFVPGGRTNSTFGVATAALDSPIKKQACAAATSPVTGLAVDAVAGTATVGIFDVVNVVGGFAASELLEYASGPLIDLVLEAVPATAYEDLASMFFGDLTADLAGMDYGDALASGAANEFGQVANAGGNMPLSVADAVAYNQETQKVDLAYAQEDRATHSPLDATNANTFMGTFVSSLLPLYGQMGSLTSALSSFSSLVGSSSTSLLFGNTYAASTADQYTLCDDPSVKDGQGENIVAAGPFCNIEYGIPSKYLQMDPQQIVDKLVAQGQVDSDTGEPIDTPADTAASVADQVGVSTGDDVTSLKKWMDLCTDGTTEQSDNCRIKDSTTALYAVYTIDHRIQKDIDNQDTDPADDSDDNTSTADTGGTKQELAKAILDSHKVQFLDANGSSAAARSKIFTDIATGKTNGNDMPCGLNLKVLQAVKEVVDNHHSVGIGDTNSLCTGATQGRSAGSRHLAGNGSAVDFYEIDGQALTGGNTASLDLLRELKPMLLKGATLHDESQVGQVGCRSYIDLGHVVQFDDACSHVHIDFPPWSDSNLKYQNGVAY